MARLTTINVPQYAVEESVLRLLLNFGKLPITAHGRVFEAIQKATSISQSVTILCDSEAQAKQIVSALQGAPQRRSVSVASQSRWGVSYDVGVEGSKAVDCTCPDFTNRSPSNPAHVCKHMRSVNNNPRYYNN